MTTNFAKPPLHILFSLTRRGNYILYWCWSRNSFHFQPLILKIFYLKRNNLENISRHTCIRFTMLLITGYSDRSVFFLASFNSRLELLLFFLHCQMCWLWLITFFQIDLQRMFWFYNSISVFVANFKLFFEQTVKLLKQVVM